MPSSYLLWNCEATLCIWSWTVFSWLWSALREAKTSLITTQENEFFSSFKVSFVYSSIHFQTAESQLFPELYGIAVALLTEQLLAIEEKMKVSENFAWLSMISYWAAWVVHMYCAYHFLNNKLHPLFKKCNGSPKFSLEINHLCPPSVKYAVLGQSGLWVQGCGTELAAQFMSYLSRGAGGIHK